MRLKVLIVPFFIVMILVLGIGYIKPDLDVIMVKKEQIATKEAQVANIDVILANIHSLNSSLDTEREAEQFMYRYLPETLNQEQVIDAFNFLAVQSGLAITKMEVEQPTAIVAAEPLTDASSNTFVTGANTLGDSGIITPAPPVSARTFILKGSVMGSYENIKALFDRLAYIERFQKIRLFSLATAEKTEIPGVVTAPDSLVGVFETEYSYLPPKHLASALGMPIFLQSKFDFSNVNSLLNRLTSHVPMLEKGETGKPNPFQ